MSYRGYTKLLLTFHLITWAKVCYFRTPKKKKFVSFKHDYGSLFSSIIQTNQRIERRVVLKEETYRPLYSDCICSNPLYKLQRCQQWLEPRGKDSGKHHVGCLVGRLPSYITRMSSEQDYVQQTDIAVIVSYSTELSRSRLLGTVSIVKQIFWIMLYNFWSWKNVVK